MATETGALEFHLRQLIDAGNSSDPLFRASIYKQQLQRMSELAASLAASGPARVRHDRLLSAIASLEKGYPGRADEPAVSDSEGSFDFAPEPQTKTALVFREDVAGLISVDSPAGRDRLSLRGESRDLHGELRHFAMELGTPSADSEIGSNSSGKVHQAAVRLIQALGDSPAEVSPGLLIPRGEALRQLHEQQERIENGELSDVAPLPESLRSQLALVVRTFNGYVSVDPELRRRDLAQLGPDAAVDLVPPSTGQRLAESALAAGAISPEALDALEQEAVNAPSVPLTGDRRSRRYSESAKNLLRSLLTLAYRRARLIGGTLVSTAVTSYGVFNWVISNEQWLRAVFSQNPRMLDLLTWLVPYLKNLPLA